ncbi:uncharacterized protein LOC122854058 [Aphidius gifuensis]|uniref:uncharacterized protein LOC122854058 n=1 Tax=Aphidius gifuensis TaxID=684658 RepID=UPI001CDCB687|nr:uncharacterized protein LOC122854058 [Aphidius gifuensis]
MEKFNKKRESELENLFSKKYKVTNEMSTPFFNEKDTEIYYKHHDHSYAENIIIDHANSIAIDFVNDDCLAEIFTYVPACERPKIALVCQKWKRALDYSWSNVRKLQITHWECAEYPNCLKKFTTPDGKLSFLKSLLYKCGRYLSQLDLTAYGRSDIVHHFHVCLSSKY